MKSLPETLESQSASQTSKMTKLPTEIMCLIFIYARDNYYRSQTHRSTHTIACEIIISHVCPSWRTMALALPQLWNTFQCTRKYRAHPHGHSKRFSVYLARSLTQPLDIWIDFQRNPFPDPLELRLEDPWVDFFLTLVGASARWRRYTMLLGSTKDHVKYRKLLRDVHAPLLEYFAFFPKSAAHLILPLLPRSLSFFTPLVLTGGAPVLQSIWLDSLSFVYNMPPLHAHLTTLRIDMVSDFSSNTMIILDMFIEVLRIPSLSNLSLSGINIREDLSDGIRGPDITMKSLKEFRCSSADVVELFQYIHTPALQTIVLKNVDFPRLFETSVLALQHLVLIRCSVPWRRLTQELSYVTASITHLTISERVNGTFQRDVLTYFDYKLDHWPKLTYLACNIPAAVGVIAFYHQFARMRAPYPLILRINSAFLDLWEAESPETTSSLRDICTLQRWDDEYPLVPLHWPYEEVVEGIVGDDTTDYDPFRINSYDVPAVTIY